MQRRSSKDSCYAGMIEAIARANYTPELGSIAETALREDPDSQVAASAATVLSEFGPASAEQALWDRFASWSETWRDRAEFTKPVKLGERDPYQSERMLE